MASSNNSKVFLYIAGTAAVTAGVYYFVNRTLREREELMKMSLMKEIGGAKKNPALPESDDDE